MHVRERLKLPGALTMDDAAFTERFLPEVTVDVVLLSIGSDGSLLTLLAQRDKEPFKGGWALPGVFVGRHESLEDAAARALADKAGIAGDVFLEQLFTFGALKRDPRGRIISVAYYALIPEGRFVAAISRNTGAAIGYIEVPWDGQRGGPILVRNANGKKLKIAFDHDRIIGLAVQRIRGKLNYAQIGFELLADEFTLFELQHIHEAVLGRKLNKDSFRRKMLASNLIEDTGKRRSGTAYRPAALYRFKN
ncbi:MAG TPA: NUDIX domain-containing protein [Candidatus Baltobacteraceae bacterium]|jgi:8-oxo-dGTP diphosphatase|nr:NUDIX domain-containing protein [Candidatus Baltobacteraceae bacterium]